MGKSTPKTIPVTVVKNVGKRWEGAAIVKGRTVNVAVVGAKDNWRCQIDTQGSSGKWKENAHEIVASNRSEAISLALALAGIRAPAFVKANA